MKTNIIYTSDEIVHLNFNITIDDIYIGKIMKYDKYSIDRNGKKRKFVFVKNALLIKLDWKASTGVNYYIELDRFNLSEIKEKIRVNNNIVEVSIDRYGELIMLDIPFDQVGTKFVDRTSIKKVECEKEFSTDSDFRGCQKVNSFLKQLNNKGE